MMSKFQRSPTMLKHHLHRLDRLVHGRDVNGFVSQVAGNAHRAAVLQLQSKSSCFGQVGRTPRALQVWLRKTGPYHFFPTDLDFTALLVV